MLPTLPTQKQNTYLDKDCLPRKKQSSKAARNVASAEKTNVWTEDMWVACVGDQLWQMRSGTETQQEHWIKPTQGQGECRPQVDRISQPGFIHPRSTIDTVSLVAKDLEPFLGLTNLEQWATLTTTRPVVSPKANPRTLPEP